MCGFIVASALVLPPVGARASAVTRLRLALTTPPHLSGIGSGDRYVVLQSWERARARRLKRRHPHLILLVYQDFGSMSAASGPGRTSSSGVAYRSAAPQHPRWFLTGRDGRRIVERGYPYLFMADVGNPGYQRRWRDDVVRLLRHGPWDGVFMDDVNTTTRPEAGSVAIDHYPNDAAYQAAVGAALAHVAPRIRATGKLSIANIGGWAEHPAVVHSWLRYVDGAMDEHFVKVSPAPGRGYREPSGWLNQEREVTATEAMDKAFLAVTPATPADTQAQLYGWASLLLVGNGNAAYLAASSYTGVAPWLPAYRARLGPPDGKMRPLRGGVYARSFAHGLVLVNPLGETRSASLGGVFHGSGLPATRRVTMRPHTGLVLVGVASPRVSSRGAWEIVVGIALTLALAFGLVWVRRSRARVGSGRS